MSTYKGIVEQKNIDSIAKYVLNHLDPKLYQNIPMGVNVPRSHID